MPFYTAVRVLTRETLKFLFECQTRLIHNDVPYSIPKVITCQGLNEIKMPMILDIFNLTKAEKRYKKAPRRRGFLTFLFQEAR